VYCCLRTAVVWNSCVCDKKVVIIWKMLHLNRYSNEIDPENGHGEQCGRR